LVQVLVRAESTTSGGPQQYSGSTTASSGPAAPTWYQAGILVQRNVRNWIRWGLPTCQHFGVGSCSNTSCVWLSSTCMHPGGSKPPYEMKPELWAGLRRAHCLNTQGPGEL
jgi:hypothetical protein